MAASTARISHWSLVAVLRAAQKLDATPLAWVLVSAYAVMPGPAEGSDPQRREAAGLLARIDGANS